MAHAIMFDTLKYTKELEAAGVKASEAEAHAIALVEIFEKQEDHVATRQDVNKVGNEIDKLKNEIYYKFAEFKVDSIKWMIGISFVQAAFIISILKFFH